MKLIHTADWHLGKLVHGVYMTEDQRWILEQLIDAIEMEKPNAVIIAGDIYDRAVPPTEAVHLLNEILETMVLKLNTPILAISGNHDSPSRLHFGSHLLKSAGLHLIGELSFPIEPVILHDEYGEVHFYLIPYADPSIVRHLLDDPEIKTHHDAMQAMIQHIVDKMDSRARHVLIGHAFVTANGETKENTSDAERPLAIGGVEFVDASLFAPFHYTALGHLHQAHFVSNSTIQYAGSPLKYSISEEHHHKGFTLVEIDETGEVTVERRPLTPMRDMRRIEGKIEEIEQQEGNEDYVFVRLLDESPVLTPVERIRAVYPNVMHVERQVMMTEQHVDVTSTTRDKLDDVSLFKAFYKEVTGKEVSTEQIDRFTQTLQSIYQSEGEHHETFKDNHGRIRAV